MFKVSIAPKTPDHIFYNKGSKMAYQFNGQFLKPLLLQIGQTYTFAIDTPNHPFYFTTNDTGAMKPNDDPAEMSKPTEIGLVTFKPTSIMPREFYYQCANHPKMGGKVKLYIEIVPTKKLLNS